MTVIIQQLVNGIVDGSIYCLIAVGITLIFGLTGLVNFAHGDFMMLGAFVALTTSHAFGPWVALLVGIGVAFVGIGALGGVLERTLFARTLSRPINGFVVSLGLIFVIENAAAIHWGANPQVVTPPLTGTVSIAGIEMSQMRLLVFGVSVLLSAAFFAYLKLTRVGTALRCCNLDRDTAMLMGINVPRMQTLAFAVGSALAGAGGVLLATIYSFTPFFGSVIVVNGFVIALAGGLGNVAGAFCAALLFGIFEAITVQVGLGAWSTALTLVFVVLMLMVRPTGLFAGSQGSAIR